MSLTLNCPGCGASVGEVSNEDNYIEKYYYKGDKGQPICKNCGNGTFEDIDMPRNIFIFAIVITVTIIALIYIL